MRKWLLAAGMIALAGLAASGALWAAPPLRLAAPGLFGMHCVQHVCTERPDDLPRAEELIAEAVAEVQAQTGLAVPPLKAVLCRSDDCYRSFGGGRERAISYPFLGMVVAGRSWQDYIVRHELIHWLQFEHFGAIETMSQPVWFREGMAYALSGAPGSDIPEPFKPWMAQYLEWQGDRTPASVLSSAPGFD